MNFKIRNDIAFIKRNLKFFSLIQFISIFYHRKILINSLASILEPIIEKFYQNNPVDLGPSKYLDLPPWILENLGRVYRLDINKRENLKILDISTGCGYFPYISNYFGNNAEGTDLIDCELYNELINILEIRRQECAIKAFTKLDIIGKFDLVTSFMICFNNHQSKDLWHIKEWDYFLDNIISDHLNPGGEIFFSFNAENVKEPIDTELLDFFKSRNAVVLDNTVHFKLN